MIKSLNKGYTMMEILMVVFIVGLLSSLAIARYDSQFKRAGVNMTKANLESIRTAIAMYYEVEGIWPVGNISELLLSAGGRKYLPAIPNEMITNKNTVGNAMTNSGGWFYDLSTHIILPNLTGNDVNGLPYSKY